MAGDGGNRVLAGADAMERDKRALTLPTRTVPLSSAAPPSPDTRWSSRSHRLVKALPAHCDIASAVASLANELLAMFPARDGAALLDRLRRRLSASEAVVWACEGHAIRRVLWSGEGPLAPPEANIDVDPGGAGIQRLRHAGTVVCRAGDVTGLEHLVPAGVQSFAAAATVGGAAVTYVLVVGWPAAVPPCHATDAVPLQVATAMLAGTLTVSFPAVELDATSEAIFASLPDPVAVVDRAGRLIAANARWTAAAATGAIGTLDMPGPSADYVESLRRAAHNGAPEAAGLVEGIAAVGAGTLDRFQTMYRYTGEGEERGAAITVTPLRHLRGGAVITYTEVPHQAVSQMAETLGGAKFHRLADEVPIPLIVINPQGQLVQANQPWWDAVGDRVGRARGRVKWTDAFDADAKASASAALHAAVSGRVGRDIELRLKGVDGRYRWWALTLAPRFAHGGVVDGCVGVCHDVTATRHMEATLGEVAKKLIAAQEAERARIARELHDDIGQQVALLATQLDTLRPASHRELESARGGLHALAQSLTSLSRQLHPGKIRLLGIVRTLGSLCREMGGEHGVQIDFDTRRVPRDLPEDCGVSLFRVAQEALRNAVKHSGATKIVVRLMATRSHLTMRITDNGKGFDPLTTQAAGIGLLTMRERVELVGGTLAVEPARPHGTTIRVVVPIVVPFVTAHARATGASLLPAAAAPRPVAVAVPGARPAFSAPTTRSSE